MCQRTTVTIRAGAIHGYAQSWVNECLQLEDHGPQCTAVRITALLLKAAARMYSIYAACRDLADAPSDQAVRNALHAMLPEIDELQKRINRTLTCGLPKRVYRYPRVVAIDMTLIPYYGQPQADPSELVRSRQKKGTTRFHGYATACLVHHGMRYTIALTRVTRGEKSPQITRRLIRQVRQTGLRIKRLLLDREFFTVETIRYLKRAGVPFLMPVAIRAPVPKDPQKLAASLRGFRKKSSGWYDYVFHSKPRERIRICVCAKYYMERKTGKRKLKRLLFAAWGYQADPETIREQYRKRFGIETSYRQVHQARIRTSERCPKLRLLYFGIGLILRNVWVWVHFSIIADRRGEDPDLHLERLRFRRMLEWIEEVVRHEMHDGTLPATQWQPG